MKVQILCNDSFRKTVNVLTVLLPSIMIMYQINYILFVLVLFLIDWIQQLTSLFIDWRGDHYGKILVNNTICHLYSGITMLLWCPSWNNLLKIISVIVIQFVSLYTNQLPQWI